MAILDKAKFRITDPVCGMTISKDRLALVASFHGKDYYFCSERCMAIFDESPEAVFAMKTAREEIVEEERMKSLDRMADDLTHEIRNPLTSIGGGDIVMERLRETFLLLLFMTPVVKETET